MEMGKVRDEPHHHSHSKIQQKPMKTVKKSIKITYISRPVMIRACDASEFRAVVQELTGKDSNKKIEIADPPTWSSKEPQDEAVEATMAAELDVCDYYNTTLNSHSLEFDEAYSWKEVGQNTSVLLSPCALIV